MGKPYNLSNFTPRYIPIRIENRNWNKLVQRILARRRPSCLHHHPLPNKHTHTHTHPLPRPKGPHPAICVAPGSLLSLLQIRPHQSRLPLQDICVERSSPILLLTQGPGGFAKVRKERPTRWTSATCGPSVGTAAAAAWDIHVVRGCVPGAAVGTGSRGPALAL